MSSGLTLSVIGLSLMLLSGCGAPGAAASDVEVDMRVCNSALASGSGGSAVLQECIFANEYYNSVSEDVIVECYFYAQYLSVKSHFQYARPDITDYSKADYDTEAHFAASEKVEFEVEFWKAFLDRKHDDWLNSLYHSQTFMDNLVIGIGGDSDGSISSLYPEEAAPKAYKKYQKCVRLSDPVFNVFGQGAD